MPESRPTTTAALYDALRRERVRQDMKWEALASRVGVKYQSLQAFEGGKAHPTEPTLRKWAKALGLPDSFVDDWFDLRTEEQVAEVLGKLRGPRALPTEDVDAIRRSVRNALRGRR